MKKSNFTVKAKTQLAKALGISRPTLDKYLAMDGCPKPDKDGAYDPKKVSEFIDGQDATGRAASKSSGDLKEKKLELLTHQIEKLRIANDKEKHRLISIDDHEATISDMITECQRVLESIPHRLAPEVVGLTVAEAEIRLRAAIDEALQKLHDGENELAQVHQDTGSTTAVGLGGGNATA